MGRKYVSRLVIAALGIALFTAPCVSLRAADVGEEVDTSLSLVRYNAPSPQTVRLSEIASVLTASMVGNPDPTNFPTIVSRVMVTDGSGSSIAGLTKADFGVTEDGVAPVDFDVTPVYGQSVSIGLVMDRSGSMVGAPMTDSQQAAHDFLGLLAPTDRAAIVSFSNGYDVRVDQDFTSDKTALGAAVDSLAPYGRTAVFDGIALGVDRAVLESGVRAVIAFTDGDDNSSDRFSRNLQGAHDLAAYASARGVPVYTIGIGLISPLSESWLGVISSESGGYYTRGATAADLSAIYQKIVQSILQSYQVTYVTPNALPDGTLRNVAVQVNHDGSSAVAAGTYIAELSPKILRTDATIALSGASQLELQPLTIEATIHDDVAVTSAKLLYRKTGSGAGYTEVAMSHGAGELWSAAIPAAAVTSPAVDYYITASDGKYTSSDPSAVYNPQQFPYQIPVQPNVGPVITHTPVLSSIVNTQVGIHADVVDNTLNVAETVLHYRKTGSVLFDTAPMALAGGVLYPAIIPASTVTTLGVDYYIRATDNFGLSSYVGSAAVPLHIDVTSELNRDLRLVPATLGASLGMMGERGFLEPLGDPISAVGAVLKITPGNKWSNFVLAAQSGVRSYIKNIEMRKETPALAQCADVFPQKIVVQQGTPNIRTWWPLLYEIPGTKWTLTVVYGTPNIIQLPGETRASYVHTDKWTWELWTEIKDIQNLLTALRTIPFGKHEVPLISDDALYRSLWDKLELARTSTDLWEQAGYLSDFELMVSDRCISIAPPRPLPGGPGTGIAQSEENPACCALMGSAEYVLMHGGVGQPSK